ncbi:hypothetical protein DFH06DRAFT_1428452 [Mycena polygramma]|nr:hypothetical protein DFH06DRAFT_1428452 [Mycena polygramma]
MAWPSRVCTYYYASMRLPATLMVCFSTLSKPQPLGHLSADICSLLIGLVYTVLRRVGVLVHFIIRPWPFAALDLTPLWFLKNGFTDKHPSVPHWDLAVIHPPPPPPPPMFCSSAFRAVKYSFLANQPLFEKLSAFFDRHSESPPTSKTGFESIEGPEEAHTFYGTGIAPTSCGLGEANSRVWEHRHLEGRGDELYRFACSGGPNQNWAISGNMIQWSGHTDCLDLTNGDLGSGNIVQIWTCTGGINQGWTMTTGPGQLAQRNV